MYKNLQTLVGHSEQAETEAGASHRKKMPKRPGGIRRKRRIDKKENEENSKGVPKSFIISRGPVTPAIKDLEGDWRWLMSPNSALKLKPHKNNSLKDFVSVSSVFGVTHLLVFTQTKLSPYLKVSRMPQGPTVTFRIEEFSLCSDVRSNQKKSRVASADFLKSALVVLNGFSVSSNSAAATAAPIQLLATVLGSMFPVIDINSFALQDCRRVVLFSYDKLTDLVDCRHYTVLKRPAGISKNVKKLISLRSNPKRFLNSKCKIRASDFILNDGCGSESEAEAVEVAAPTTHHSRDGNVVESSTKLAVRQVNFRI